MKFDFEKKKVYRGLHVWLLLQTVAVMIGSVMIFELIDFFANRVFSQHFNYDPILGIGMLLPMGIMMGGISYFFSRAVFIYISRLLRGIDQVADGDLTTQLEVKKGGPFKDVYEKFNKMVLELRSVQIFREDFINQYSHEFKTPIASINGFADLLLNSAVSPADQKTYLKIIASESERLSRLSNSVLMLSKLESLQFIANKENYALDEQLKRCSILLSDRWLSKSIDFSADLEPVTYCGNADLMQHVFVNLIDNAIKYTPEHGEISVVMKKEPPMVRIAVCDTGKGMSPEEQGQIFSKYFQGSQTETQKGLGLGLAIVWQIVTLCGGRIEVTSRIGEGSCFTVFLPE